MWLQILYFSLAPRASLDYGLPIPTSQFQNLFPGHPRPVITKPVGRIFETSNSNPILRKYGKSLSPPEEQGSEEIPQSKNAENEENAEPKRGKCR